MADTDHPARIGAAQSFGGFIDVFVICMVSGFIFTLIAFLGISGTPGHYQINDPNINWRDGLNRTLETFKSNGSKDVVGISIFGFNELLFGIGKYFFWAIITFFGFGCALGAIMIAEFCIEWFLRKFSKNQVLFGIKSYNLLVVVWILFSPFVSTALGNFVLADLFVVLSVILEGILIISLFSITRTTFNDFYAQVKSPRDLKRNLQYRQGKKIGNMKNTVWK